MNIAQLKLSQKKLLDNLVSRGYDIQYIKGVKFVLRLLFEHEGCFHSYEQFAEKFIRTRGYTKATLDLRMMHLRTIQAYDEFGHYPDKKSFVPLCYPSRYNRAAEHKKKSTVKMETDAVTMFLFEMQKFHVSSLDEIKEEHVLSFFLKEEQQKRSRTYCGHIASALKELGDLYDMKKVLGYFPDLKYERKNFNYLKDDEINVIKNALSDSNNILTFREKAIVSLALYTGIRGCDIANLKLTDIDWKKERVSFVQEKTGNPIVLPLLPHVGNSLFDYIRNERDNEAGSVYLFPNKKNATERLENKSIGTIVNTVFEKLNLRKGESGRGVSVFRHNLASKLLGKGTEIRVICSSSIVPYIDADIPHLRECGINIECYPIRKELFE
ncbi:tyrosine-type recombinase/integrase [uncultured Bacteroides sp.]|uniref:tyrosine-type recombinase/integrase n=1 Tax=uncultured Bacteroides sp. TaxID=162156 RepID=UPI002620A5BB|nr:tyrosine-type recombinase/integrase [uncultured Bacteroides sp.]